MRHVILVLALLATTGLGPVQASHELPDLVGTIEYIPDVPDQPFRVTIYVENFWEDGSADAGPFQVDLLVDGSLIQSFEVLGLAAESWTELTSEPFQLEEGDRNFEVRVDANDDVVEGSEANTWVGTVHFSLLHPDVSLDIIGVATSGLPGGETWLLWRACNRGDLSTREAVRILGSIRPYLDQGTAPESHFWATTVTLEPSQCVTGAELFPHETYVGRYDTKVYSFVWGPAREVDRSNNDETASFLIHPAGARRL